MRSYGTRDVNPAFLNAHSHKSVANQAHNAMSRAMQTGILNLAQKHLKTLPVELGDLSAMEGPDGKWWETNPITKMDFSENYLEDLPERLAVFGDVINVNLTYNSFKIVPSVLMAFEKLSLLNLSHNKLTELPEFFAGAFPELKTLLLNDNQLTALPANFGALQGLTELNLAQNKLKALPASVTMIPQLGSLNVAQNELTELPEALGDLTRLHTLNASQNRIDRVPETIRRLLHLETLHLQQNQLETLIALPRSQKLHTLDLSNNRIVILQPDQFALCPNIATLLLRRNKLTDISPVCQLAQLNTLDVAENDLSDLPNELGFLQKLAHFNQDGNRIRSIRPTLIRGPIVALKQFLRERSAQNMAVPPPPGVSVDEFQRYQQDNSASGDPMIKAVREAAATRKFIINDHPISQLPPNAAGLSEIVQADISGCPLVDLPDEAPGRQPLWPNIRSFTANRTLMAHTPMVSLQWSGLTELNLERCRLTTLFAPLAVLRNLTKNCWPNLKFINISNNNVPILPRELADAAPMLQELRANNCKLKDLGPISGMALEAGPSASSRRSQPSSQGFTAFNSAQGGSEVVWGNLRTLELTNNQIAVAPPSLPAMLPQLHALLLSNNSITNLPSTWGNWESLQVFTIDGNPQRSLRQHTLQKGINAIKDFLAGRTLPPKEQLTAEQIYDMEEEALKLARVSQNPKDAAFMQAAENMIQRRLDRGDAPEGPNPLADAGPRLIRPVQTGDITEVPVPYFPTSSENEEQIRMMARNAANSYTVAHGRRAGQQQEINPLAMRPGSSSSSATSSRRNQEPRDILSRFEEQPRSNTPSLAGNNNNMGYERAYQQQPANAFPAPTASRAPSAPMSGMGGGIGGNSQLQMLIAEEKQLLEAIEGVGLSRVALMDAKKRYARVHAERMRIQNGL